MLHVLGCGMNTGTLNVHFAFTIDNTFIYDNTLIRVITLMVGPIE